MTARVAKKLAKRKVKPPLPGTKPGSCGAPRNSPEHRGEPCRRAAGYRTGHPGQGRCSLHGGQATDRFVSHGIYSMVTHHRVSEVLQRLSEQEMNVMDLIPEANVLRALTIDFINRYDQFQDALMAWYADPESNTRPRKVVDLADASHLIESISRVVHRMHQIQNEGAISLETFKRVTEHMGIIVAKYTKDPVVLQKIEDEWMDLALDAKSAPPTPVE